jgi:hypothetical protein
VSEVTSIKRKVNSNKVKDKFMFFVWGSFLGLTRHFYSTSKNIFVSFNSDLAIK